MEYGVMIRPLFSSCTQFIAHWFVWNGWRKVGSGGEGFVRDNETHFPLIFISKICTRRIRHIYNVLVCWRKPILACVCVCGAALYRSITYSIGNDYWHTTYSDSSTRTDEKPSVIYYIIGRFGWHKELHVVRLLFLLVVFFSGESDDVSMTFNDKITATYTQSTHTQCCKSHNINMVRLNSNPIMVDLTGPKLKQCHHQFRGITRRRLCALRETECCYCVCVYNKYYL